MSATPDTQKIATPAYGSFKTLVAFANDVREGGHVPLQVDRTLMPKLSGSAVSETISGLRFLNLVAGDKTVKPTALFEKFVMAADEERPAVLRGLLTHSYAFLLNATDFDIERASGQQVIDLFRAQGVNGSTLVRAISFFLSAAKDAGIKVSHNVKPPKLASNGSKQKREKKAENVPSGRPSGDEGSDSVGGQELPPGTHRFEIPIPGKASVLVVVPEALDADDWEMLSQMFGLYVQRWKRYPLAKAKEPDNT